MMTIKSANMTIGIVSLSILIVFSISSVFAQQAPIWPIRPNIANWDRVNCTFGEVHSGGAQIHSAIDIDQDPALSASVVQPGRVDATFFSNPGTGVTVYHEYRPNSGNEFRRTQYLHLTGGIPAFNTRIGTGDSIGVMGDHLHFVMEERINGEWVRLNPLDKDSAWNLRYHQHLETRPDRYDPQVNDIYIEPKTGRTAPGQPQEGNNGVASGFWYDPNTAVGLSQRVANNVTYCRAHLATTQFSQFSTGATIQYPQDTLVVFGNIGVTANVRDVGVNSVPGAGAQTSSGEGLTIKRLQYSIENQREGIHVPVKYDINFEQIKENDRSSIDQIFNPHFDPNHVIWGNNDFIELRSGDDVYLSPYPHQLIEFRDRQGQQVQEQSNGIWFTKARGDTEDVFQYTPDANHVAGCNIGNFSEGPPAIREAKYPDSEYILKFFAQDDYGRVNRDASGSDVAAQLPVIKLFARDPQHPDRIKVYQDWYDPQHAKETKFS